MMRDQANAVGVPAGQPLAGRYRLVDRVGTGGMAQVFAAHDEVLDRSVAVKLFRFDAVEGEARRRVEAEIRIVAALRHPGIVTVFDAAVPADGTPGYLVMELIDGPSLASRLAGGPLSRDDVALLGAQVAAALGYLHAQGVVHRDVKPANILLDTGSDPSAAFTAKLTDFGVARLIDSPRLTAAGLTVGTANYLSPEQVSGAEIGAASDVYALGLVLLECLTGQRVYPGNGVSPALARLDAPPVVPTSLGQPWTRLLSEMTALDPQARPSTEAVVGHLRHSPAAARGSASPTTSTTLTMPTPASTAGSTAASMSSAAEPAPAGTRIYPTSPPGARPRRPLRMRWALLAAACAAALLAVLLIGVLSSRGTAHPPAPSPTYPTVPGTVGAHLQQLESAVG